MTLSERRRLGAVEQRLADALAREEELRAMLADLARKQRADHARLVLLRELLADEPEPERPELRVLEGARRASGAGPGRRSLRVV